ncbi:SRPBCC family protein [Salana multivorans]
MTIADEINKVIRTIRTSGESHQVVLDRTFDTDIADLWDACTSPERLARWFEPTLGDLAPGGRYTLTRSSTQGDILTCEPPRHLAITWEYQGDVSHVDVELLAATNQRTALRLTHHCPPGDHWDTYGPTAAGVGWEESLRALGLHLAGDARSAPDEMDSVASTPEGQELTRRAAEAWGRADEAAGTPANEAEARALRTAAFHLST